MSKIINAIDELLLELRDQNKIEQTDVRDINQSIRAKIKRHARDKKQEKLEKKQETQETEYNFQGVGK